MIKRQFPLGFQWPTQEPFLFCVHHNDLYPKGDANFGPGAQHMAGRNMGSDFEPLNGFRMYHGEVVPGFPVHPHRGFETVTIVRKGYLDHSDSMGAAGRYGEGDVQWMTAGRGVQHSEMFPLLHADQTNTVELFQIWLNLPKKNKMVDPFFEMFWNESIPAVLADSGKVRITVIAGEFDGTKALTPPPNSWAADPQNQVGIWIIKLDRNSSLTLPAAAQGCQRTLYVFEGDQLRLGGHPLRAKSGVEVEATVSGLIETSDSPAEILVLQSNPIGEPVVQHGPFVMNTQAEIKQTIMDYQSTQFGGWPWPREDMVHGGEIRRFAKYPDGKVVSPKG
jgi:redox-sensitive bicupin YhaK (pirin superfamily)